MNPGFVLGLLAVIAGVLVLAVGAATFFSVRRPWRISCPRDGRDARIQVAPTAAVRAEVFGGERRIARCSLWPVLACGEGCLDTPATARTSVRPGEPLPKSPSRRTVLVPLDGTPESEAVLPTARALARGRGGRVRLLRVMPPTETVRDVDERVVAYLDQEASTVEAAGRDYLGRIQRSLEGFEVDTVVRFGEPSAEILHEAEAQDVAVIAMAARQRGWLRRSVTARVAREAWVPVVRTRYGATA
jgi:nucleotide-binding universal stress UspA family protein